MKNNNARLKLFGEVMGLSPLPVRIKQAAITFFGEKDVPASKIGFSSLRQLHPKISPKLWRGKHYVKNKVIISNLFNHTQTPIERGWSVAKTQTKDFRGKNLTYDSHNGTDFAIPVGSKVCSAAAGEIVAIKSEFNRGGLKVFIDHGHGLMTCYAHLARVLVKEGDIVANNQVIALSGYSGLDGFLTFPWGIPHVHFNVWHNSFPTDPFPHPEKISIWNKNFLEDDIDSIEFIPSEFDDKKTEKIIENCKTEKIKKQLLQMNCPRKRAFHTIIEMNYYPTRFKIKENIYIKTFDRIPILNLPFLKSEFNEIVFLDDLKKR